MGIKALLDKLAGYDLEVDLQAGMVPISKAASSLAALFKRTKATKRPIIVTHKGYPSGVIIDVELFSTLRDIARERGIEVQDPREQQAE